MLDALHKCPTDTNNLQPRAGFVWALGEDRRTVLRATRARDIPIVVFTGQIEPWVRERTTRQGCVAVLVKPCLPEILADTLRRFSTIH